MRYRIRFKYPHETNQIIRPNFKKAGTKYVQEWTSIIQGGDDFCWTKIDAGTIEGKINAKWKRINKQVAKQKCSEDTATSAGLTNSE